MYQNVKEKTCLNYWLWLEQCEKLIINSVFLRFLLLEVLLSLISFCDT